MIVCLCLHSVIADVFTLTLAFQFAGSHQLPKGTLYRAEAESRTQFADILFGKAPYFVLRCEPYRVKCRAFGFHKCETVCKILICCQDGSEQILDKWNRIVCPLMPAILRCRERNTSVTISLHFGDLMIYFRQHPPDVCERRLSECESAELAPAWQPCCWR